MCEPSVKNAIVAFFGRERDDINRVDGINITHIFRADMTLFLSANLHLQVSDLIYCIGPDIAVSRLESNQLKKLDHPNILTIFIGLCVGIFVDSIPLAVPGLPVPLKLGLAGGPLIVAILLSRFGSTLKLGTFTTPSANLMMREMRISPFLASVSLVAGSGFMNAMTQTNSSLFVALGLLVTVIPSLAVGALACITFKVNYHLIVGFIAGTTTDAPVHAYGSTLSENNSAIVAYSTVYPLAMFLRILSGQLALVILWPFIAG